MKTAFGILLNAYLIFILALTLVLSHDSNQDKPSAIAASFQHSNTSYEDAPDFSSIKNTKEKKQAFFNYFAPIIADENQRILSHRKQLSTIKKTLQSGTELNTNNIRHIDEYAKKYRVKPIANKPQQLEEILERANAVPVSLALAQAANESAWGTSRFARDGKNYFGQWCFSKGCGLVPKYRSANSTHEVQVFQSPADSVKAYIRNINTHRAYDDLRQLRVQAEKEGLVAGGTLLAEGLLHYSERGHEYVNEIQAMIRINQLDSFDLNRQIGTL